MRAVAIASDFTFPVPDRPGSLATLAGRLRAADVNLFSIRAVPIGPDGEPFVSCVPESADQFRDFAESADLDVVERPVVWIEGVDEAGALRRVLEDVATAGVNVESVDAIAFTGRYGAILRVSPRDWPVVLAIVQGTDPLAAHADSE